LLDCTTTTTEKKISLDGVDLKICIPFVPDYLASAPKSSIVQSAVAVKQTPYQELYVYSIPYGVKPLSDTLPVASPGIGETYRALAFAPFSGEVINYFAAPMIQIFDQKVPGQSVLVPNNIGNPAKSQQLIIKWIVEAGNRVWIISLVFIDDNFGNINTLFSKNSIHDISLTSSNVGLPSISIPLISILQQFPSTAENLVMEPTASDLPFPNWWNGECNENNHPGSYPLEGFYLGVKACGPLGTLREVDFGVGVHQYEWQCAEYSKRYLYLAYGTHPYAAHGKDVVWNYPGTSLEKVNNGTPNNGPSPGDVISYSGPDPSYGHTAVVSSANIDGNGNGIITVVEQNASANGINSHNVSSWTVISNYGVSGWLHDSGGDALLPAPDLYSPNYGGQSVSTKPYFDWSTVSGATHYWLMIAKSKSDLPTLPSAINCPNCIISVDNITSSYYSTPSSQELEEGETYFWQVQPYEWNGSSVTRQGEYSSQYQFTVEATLLPPPTLYSPNNDASNITIRPYFDWSSISGANRYWLMVAENQSDLPTNPDATSCPNCVISEDDISSSNYSTPVNHELSQGKTYYWQVQAFEWDGSSVVRQGEFSQQYHFDTESLQTDRINGIDVSEAQGSINWAQVNGSGYQFAFVKASAGDERVPIFIDEKYHTNMNNARDAGILVSAYHFAYPDNMENSEGNSPESEARHFLSIAGVFISEEYLRPVLDLECGAEWADQCINDRYLSKTELSNWVQDWMEYVKDETGVEPIIYTTKNYAQNHLEQYIADQYDLWIAHWTTNQSPDIGIWSDWDFWQYDSQGSVPGITGDVDLDAFNGDSSKLNSFVISGLTQPFPIIVDSLGIIQASPYDVGDILTSQFSITNRGNAPITFDELVAGGRLNGVDDCSNYTNAECPDFTKRYSITLNPGESYNYSGSFTPELLGTFEFQVFYKENGEWHWNIPTDPGVSNNISAQVGGSNSSPHTPGNPTPTDNATNVSVNTDLSWTGGDPDLGDSITYDIYLEANNSSPDQLICNNAPSTSCDPDTLSSNAHYYWYVVATDDHGVFTTGPLWDFTTTEQPDPTWYIPSATGKAENEWSNPENAYLSDNIYTTTEGTYLDQDFYNFDFDIPSNAIINGIEVAIEGYGGDYTDGRILVEIWSTSSNTGRIPPLGNWGTRNNGQGGWWSQGYGSDTIVTGGGPDDLWGVSWVPSDFSNDNFLLKITTFSNSNRVYVDQIKAKVHYTIASEFCDNVDTIPFSECDALVAFYYSTGGNHWKNNTGWLSTYTPCDWFGVNCEGGNVTDLTLNSNQLSGTLPSELENLSYIRLLYLGNNNLLGGLPLELGNLTNLMELELWGNELNGSIPSTYGNMSNLRSLALQSNHLSGSIPPELGNILNLIWLNLWGNELTGSIPPELGSLSNLVSFNLSENNLTGPLPEGFGILSSLEGLYLNDNQFSGALPQNLTNLINLIGFHFHNTQLCVPPDSYFQSWISGISDLHVTGDICSSPEISLWGNGVHITNGDNAPTDVDHTDFGNVTTAGDPGTRTFTIKNTGESDLVLNGISKVEITGTHSGDFSVTIQPVSPIKSNDTSTFTVEFDPNTVGFREATITINNNDGYNNPYSFDIQGTGEWIPQIEKEALEALYNSTDGPNWMRYNNFDLTSNPCNWGFVTCSRGHVIALSLALNQLSGTIPPELGNLSHLQWLDLDFNQLSGMIPPEVGNLSNLERLSLSQNQLSGSIPSGIGNLSHLESLNLRMNDLTGTIPPELSNLSSLKWLSLEWNHLSGSIPVWLGDLSNLRSIDLVGNQFTGAIPPELGSLPNLQELDLQWNQLTGTIPPELGNLQNLETLELENNKITGTIPSELGNLSKLVTLDLSINKLTGTIPLELGNLHNLELISLSSNDLTGSIPSELGSLSNLENLSLSNNELIGMIPPEIGSLSNLKGLYLSGNLLTGTIPPELGTLSNLESLYLGTNELSGAIPPELSNLSKLLLLNLQKNLLTGSIPIELCNLPKLQELYLYENQLSGTIPPKIGDLPLKWLGLDGNQLSGTIPPELGKLDLQWLYLDGNHFTGTIPPELGNISNLQKLYLSKNQLTGTIPTELGNLIILEELHLEMNNLSGELPTSITNLINLGSAEYETDFGYNMLSSTDPNVIAFLNKKDFDWEQTQTVPPSNVHISNISSDTVELSWIPLPTPSPDLIESGYYEISYATVSGGTYTISGTTNDKRATGYVVDGLSPGTTYYFIVQTFTPAQGDQQNNLLSDYSQEVSAMTSPPNDDIADAMTVSLLPYTNSQFTTGAVLEIAEPDEICGYDNAASVWYRFSPNADGIFTVDTYGSGYDTVVHVFKEGSDEALTPNGCNDDDWINGTSLSRVVFSASVGHSYLIGITHRGDGSGGNLTLNLNVNPCPSGSLCMTTLDHNGNPLQNPNVQVFDSNGEFLTEVRGGWLDGYVEIPSLAVGKYKLVVSAWKTFVVEENVSAPGYYLVSAQELSGIDVVVKDLAGTQIDAEVVFAESYQGNGYVGYTRSNRPLTIYATPGSYNITTIGHFDRYILAANDQIVDSDEASIMLDASSMPTDIFIFDWEGDMDGGIQAYAPFTDYSFEMWLQDGQSVVVSSPEPDYSFNAILNINNADKIWNYYFPQCCYNTNGGGEFIDIPVGGLLSIELEARNTHYSPGEIGSLYSVIKDKYGNRLTNVEYCNVGSIASGLNLSELNVVTPQGRGCSWIDVLPVYEATDALGESVDGALSSVDFTANYEFPVAIPANEGYWEGQVFVEFGPYQEQGIDTTQFEVTSSIQCFSLDTYTNPTEGGSIIANTAPNCDNGTKYTDGTQVSLTANPSSNYYRFTNWSVGAIGSTNPVQITMDADKSVTANFEQSTFGDVPFDHQHWTYIEALWDSGYTAGCNTDPLLYCPDTILNRGMAAVFMLRAHLGTGYTPPTEQRDTFADNWSSGLWAKQWAEGMWQEGFTAGCNTAPMLYCPWDLLPRVQASVFGVRMKRGVDFVPTLGSGTLLADMPDVNFWGCPWSEQAYLDELLPECGRQDGKPLYCPDDLVNRAWAAYMIVKAKNLPLPP